MILMLVVVVAIAAAVIHAIRDLEATEWQRGLGHSPVSTLYAELAGLRLGQLSTRAVEVGVR
eukprot:COSAG05_NODE_16476_length_345_cov_0.800813_2_plen_62_part_00